MKALSKVDSTQFPMPIESPWLDPHQVALHDDLEALRILQHRRSVEGLPTWDLSMVNPDLPPPRVLMDRLLESVTKSSNHRYAVSRGVRRLREACSHKYRERFEQVIDPETQVCVCLGSKDGTFHALRVLIRSGDAVVVPSPSYPAHPPAVSLAGGRSVFWEFSQDPEQAAASLEHVVRESGAVVLLLNAPTNPTGLTVSALWWRSVGAVCARLGVTIVNDFVYGEMCFSGSPAESALQTVREGARCVEVYSLSKAYNVPGWRVGALVGDAEIVSAVARMKSNADYGLFLPLQYAAAVALTAHEDLVRPTVQTYQRRLRVLASGIHAMGWEVITPEAGACLWVKNPELVSVPRHSSYRSIDTARHVLSQIGVVVTPGVVFGPHWDGWMRLAAVTNEERLREVVRGLQKLFQG